MRILARCAFAIFLLFWVAYLIGDGMNPATALGHAVLITILYAVAEVVGAKLLRDILSGAIFRKWWFWVAVLHGVVIASRYM